MLSDYVFIMTNDRYKAESLTNVLAKLGVPMKTFSTAVKLYRKVLMLAEQDLQRQRHLYRHKSGPETLFFKTDRKTAGLGTEKRREAGCREDGSEHMGEDVFSLESLIKNPYLLLIACNMIAYKYNKDIPYANEMWAQQARLDCRQVNRIERTVLEILDYQLSFEGEKQILEEIRPYLTNECSVSWTEKKKKKRMYQKIFCF